MKNHTNFQELAKQLTNLIRFRDVSYHDIGPTALCRLVAFSTLRAYKVTGD